MHDIPTAEADEFEWLIAEQAGVLTIAQAEAFFSSGVVRGHLRQRRWRRLCRGVLLAENGRLMRDQQLWAAVLVAGEHARLAGRAAAIEGGVRGLRAEPIDVLVPAGRTRSGRLPRLAADMPAVRIHRTGVLPARHRQTGPGGRRGPPSRERWCPFRPDGIGRRLARPSAKASRSPRLRGP